MTYLSHPIKSILDSDKYKFTMQQAVLEHYHDHEVTYRFKNRRNIDTFTPEMVEELKMLIHEMAELKLSEQEYFWLKQTESEVLKPMYLEYLKNYRYDPSEVTVWLDTESQLQITISGPWHSTILWEVPLMAMISEVYFRLHPEYINAPLNVEDYKVNLLNKVRGVLDQSIYADFGTRRRFSFEVQDSVVSVLKRLPGFVGTSNVYLAMLHNVKAIGTMAHEFIMGVSALEGLRYANRRAMEKWSQTYHGKLGIVLTDTYGVDDFLKHFDNYYARLFDGVRHDSGCPYMFADKVITHYQSLGINPRHKTIVFSDGLTPETAKELQNYCKDKINCSFGIGTNLTNDTGRTKALNMVIKLRSVDGIDVVKLSDIPSKATGEENAIAVAMNTFFNKKIVDYAEV